MANYTNVTIAQADDTGLINVVTGDVALTSATNVFIRVAGLPRSGFYLTDLELDIDVACNAITFTVDVVRNESAPLTLGATHYKYRTVKSYTISSTVGQTPTNFAAWFSDDVASQWRYHPRQDYEAIIFRLRRTSSTGLLVFYDTTGVFTSTETAEPRHTPSGLEYVEDTQRGIGRQLGLCARTDRVYPVEELVTDPVTGSQVHWRFVDPPEPRSRPTRRT